MDLQLLKQEDRILVRKIEKTIYKENNAKTAVDFNKACILNGLLPKYTYSRQANSKRVTPHDRLTYLESELRKKEDLVKTLQRELAFLQDEWNKNNIPDSVRTPINSALERLADDHLSHVRRRTGRKLSTLYGGPLEIPRKLDQFLNLSSTTLTEKQREFLNMGLNCHHMTKSRALDKRIELEMLLEDIQKLENDQKLITSPDLQAEIIREAKVSRGHQRSSLLTPELRTAAQELKNNDRIVIRRADKSAIFVILDKEAYLSKMSAILSDTSKFREITRNPTNNIKTKLNRIIRHINNSCTTKLPIIEGDYKLGYAYGNVKTHKAGNPLRPIISQTPSVTYKLAKRLNDLIAPFTPASFSLKSTTEFLDLLKTTQPSNIIASLDVESLFTNVPVNETIDIICQRIYHSQEKPLNIPETSLRLLLQACTKEAPFYGPDGKMYVQQDGVAMGSPLGVLFANFYMGFIEEDVFSKHPHLQPKIYSRYVDDIFVSAINIDHINTLMTALKTSSCLNFTRETEEDKKLPFLDVLVHRGDTSFSTEVHVKSTNLGFCLNGASECPERYRRSVISAFVKRALTHTSTWEAMNMELKRVGRLLANNGYPQREVDDVIKRRLDTFISPPSQQQDAPKITLYYKNTMSTAYKEDEKALKNIIHENVKPTSPDTKLDLVIYYKSRKTANLIMKNSCLPPTSPLQAVNVVYQHKCTLGDCSRLNSRYIGVTTTTLSKRITAHLTDGAIRRHYLNEHGLILKRRHMDDNTTILTTENNIKKLRMTEAVLIHTLKPSINIQQQPDTSLPSRKHRTRSSSLIG